jgi:hypothetical protein
MNGNPVSSLLVNVYEGTRQLFQEPRDFLIRITDGNQKKLVEIEKRGSSFRFPDLPFYDNFGDNYCVLVSSDGYKDAGFVPVKLSPAAETVLDIMMIPNKPGFRFVDASWDVVKELYPFLGRDVDNATGAKRYEDMMESDGGRITACLLNLCTAMEQIFLPHGTPTDYIKQIDWARPPAQDRLFAYCDEALLNQVVTAARQGLFAPELGAALLHPGATDSWKQIQFGEADVQLTFHADDKAVINGVNCIVVEPDIDYYKDAGAHAIFEVLPNGLTHTLTDPSEVYVLRWMAGMRAGVPEFAPPYTIV